MSLTLKERFDRSCRLCAEEQDVSIMIFGAEAEAMHLQNKLNKYLLLEVDEDDKLPKNICISCCTRLNSVCDFIDNVRRSQETLHHKSLLVEEHLLSIKNCARGNDAHPNDNQVTEIEVSIDPMTVLQNSLCEGESMSPTINDHTATEEEDVTYLHDVDSDNVTIKLIKKVDGEVSEGEDKKDEEKTSTVKPFPCVKCRRSFCTELALKNHVWTHNEGVEMKQFQCGTCDESFDYKNDLMDHLKEHRTKESCEICGRTFRSEKNLAAHMEAHGNAGSSYTCKVCLRSYNTLSNLKTHSITHSNERPYKCHLCKKCFKRKQDLKFHINQHTGAKPYKCPFCDKAFASSGNCYSHRSRMHPGKTVESSPARRRVTVNRELQRAGLARTAIANLKGSTNKYQCNLCDHSFLKRDNFTYHMFQHTGEKPFTCTFCPEKFVTRRGLLLHHDKLHHNLNRPLALISKNVLLK